MLYIEKKLLDSEEVWRFFMEHAPIGVVIRDVSGRYVEVNVFAEKLLGCQQGELLNISVTDILKDALDEGGKRYLLKVIKDGYCESESRFKYRCKDGRLIDVMVSSFRLNNDYFIAFIQDVSDNKLSEEERIKFKGYLLQAQRLESLGRLAGGMAHDFNNMLSVILTNTELALEMIAADQPVYEKLEEIMLAAKRSAELTKNLLAFIRREDVTPEVIRLNETINNILKMLRRLIGEDIRLNWIPGLDLWPVKIDPSHIDHILANMCVNARDAIEGSGRIDIKTGNISLDSCFCSDHPGAQPGEYVLLSVSDNGCGMDRKTLNRLFEPFYTTKKDGKGTGLGLAMVHGIIKHNNGFIIVDSEPGAGTTFKIYFPRHEIKEEPMHGPKLPVSAGLGHENILLVENEAAVMETGRQMLERLGYNVLTATMPSEAICLARECELEIQLLITDTVMPEMNGSDLADIISSIHPGIKHLFISGHTGSDINHHGIFKNKKNIIQKPFSLSTLAVRVREALEGDWIDEG